MIKTVKRVLARHKGETVGDARRRASVYAWFANVISGPIHAGRAWVFVVRAA